MNKRVLDLLLPILIFLSIIYLNLPLANNELMSHDTSCYLDMGRNFFLRKEAVISYNCYNFWPGKFYPFLPYMPPLYPIVAGFIWYLSNSIKVVIAFNIVLLAFNCVLLYKIIRTKLDCLSSFLVVLYISFSHNLIYTAIWPLTEQLHLLFLLLSILIYINNQKTSFIVGILFALSCLVRVASFFNVIGFLIAITIAKGSFRESMKDYFKFVSGFLIIFLIYEIVCYTKYGSFYPQYPLATKNSYASTCWPGATYKNSIPALCIHMPSLPTTVILSNMLRNLKVFSNELLPIIKFGSVSIILCFIFGFYKKEGLLFFIFLFQGLAVIVGYVVSYYFLSQGFSADSYAIIPLITFACIMFFSMRKIIDKLAIGNLRGFSKIAFAVCISAFLALEMPRYKRFMNEYTICRPKSDVTIIFKQKREQVYPWIRENTKENDLIAGNLIADAFLLHRPVVALYAGAYPTEENLRAFLEVYKPTYVLIGRPSKPSNAYLVTLLKKIGLVERKRIGEFILLN